MRVIAGARRGAKLYTGKAAGFRPTSDRVREAIFSILGEVVDGRRVLDLFAGSGGLGLEALSRGAADALFVEKNRSIASWIERNGRDLRFEERIAVARRDVRRFLEKDGRAGERDLVFVDPPYREGLVAETIALLAALPGDRYVIVERDRREESGTASLEPWRRPASYGDTIVEFLAFGGDAGGEPEGSRSS